MPVDQFSIILVEPQGPLNIGSICRAMANFGFNDLRLVTPEADHLCDEARRMAVKATPLLEKARIFPSLHDALADCHFAMGTTRRFGKYRKNFLHPDQAALHLLPLSEEGRVGLVFGREDHGLFTAELDLCQRLITIPTNDNLPSMNLAQAAALCLYEIHKAASAPAAHKAKGKKLAQSEQLEAMLQHMRRSMMAIEYLDPQNPDHIIRTYRSIFGRAQLNEREVRTLQGLWSRIDWINEQLKKNK
ncbi:MAG: RNA methyltransferase [Proteobacteria bacterium]|nr:RNA methyltransferase [Desulfobulbaceae bacterium]MBU4152137.1 RNA methyltransferase [Pseudomonadota bacterium]MDP2105187.1 RNA methyltransferase [Desulfobulbaceae bacterium]